MVRVFIIESERGWGQRVDKVIEFPTREQAEEYCTAYNDEFNPPMERVTDWYMYATVEGDDRSKGMRRSG